MPGGPARPVRGDCAVGRRCRAVERPGPQRSAGRRGPDGSRIAAGRGPGAHRASTRAVYAGPATPGTLVAAQCAGPAGGAFRVSGGDSGTGTGMLGLFDGLGSSSVAGRRSPD